MRYNLALFTDTNSVICKIIVGGLASLFEGGGICEANDGGSVVLKKGHSPRHGLRRASPLPEGAKGCRRKGERYMKATGIVRRVDDLGRIVIPKEIRRTLKIREGEPLDNSLTLEDKLAIAVHSILKRYKAQAR